MASVVNALVIIVLNQVVSYAARGLVEMENQSTDAGEYKGVYECVCIVCMCVCLRVYLWRWRITAQM